MRCSLSMALKWAAFWFFIVIVLYVAYTLEHPISHYASDFLESYAVFPSSSTSQSVIANETLGFEKIFAVGLPERSDKRDALVLTSSLTGFKIDWIDGVRGESVPDKAVPSGADRARLWEGDLGSWRGHMNAIRTIVEKGYATTLIMEDDMDWDVHLKSQLLEFAKGARFLQSFFSSKDVSSQRSDSPYGNNWDLLWLGHCGEKFPETLEENVSKSPKDPDLVSISRKYNISPDDTVPPPGFATGFQDFAAAPYTRWVHITGEPICSFAYALSFEGARKVLYDLSVDRLSGNFDNALAGLCRWGREKSRLGMRCISTTPPLFFHHMVKGSISGDSDIQKKVDKGKGEEREKGTTENIVQSVRNNIRNMIMGSKMENQFAAS